MMFVGLVGGCKIKKKKIKSKLHLDQCVAFMGNVWMTGPHISILNYGDNRK